MARYGHIDVLLNNAGRSMPKGILDITEDEFDRTIAINLKSCFNYIRAVAPVMQGAGRRPHHFNVLAERPYGGVTPPSAASPMPPPRPASSA